MVMTRTRCRRQSTLTFLVDELMSVEREIERLSERKRKPGAPEAGRLRPLEARRLALVEAVRQFDPELDVEAIAGVVGVEGGGHG